MIVRNDRRAVISYDFISGHEYEVIVRAVGPDGVMQAMENAARNTIVIKGKLDTPNPPTSVSAEGFLNSITVSWVNPPDYDFARVELWRAETNDMATASKLTETSGTLYIDVVGAAGVTRYYWLRAVGTSGKMSGYTGVAYATSEGVTATDIDDFAITATKMFTNTIVLTGDAWVNNSPGAGSIAWNAHSIVYNGASYPITAGNTALAYVYWTIGNTTYTGSAAHPTLGTTAFMVAINQAGIHTMVWNSSANMVIGTAFIAELAVTNAKIFSLSASKLTAGTIDASVITVTNLNATNITTGTLTGRTVQTAASGARTQLFPDANTGLVIYDNGGAKVFEALVAGTDVGDVIIGDYANNKGLKYDKSAGTFNIKGVVTVTAGSNVEIGADVTSTHTAAAISGQGALATKTTADFATDVSGATKPANNATVGGTWGVNIASIPIALTEDDTPAASGVYITPNYIGFYDQPTAAWPVRIKNNAGAGEFYVGDGAAEYISYASGVMTVRGTLDATDITAGTLTGRTVQTDTGAVGHYKRVELKGASEGTYPNSVILYDDLNNPIIRIDDTLWYGANPGIEIVSATSMVIVRNALSTELTFLQPGTIGITTNNAGYPIQCGDSVLGDWTFRVYYDGSVRSKVGYKVGTTQVVGAQGAAVADATDAASVILRLNDLLARCRTHGLIAT